MAVLDAVQRPVVTLTYQPTTFSASYYETSVQRLEDHVSRAANKAAGSNLEVGHATVRKKHQSKIDAIHQAVTKYFGLRTSDLKTATR